jgi:hypothetical protein
LSGDVREYDLTLEVIELEAEFKEKQESKEEIFEKQQDKWGYSDDRCSTLGATPTTIIARKGTSQYVNVKTNGNNMCLGAPVTVSAPSEVTLCAENEMSLGIVSEVKDDFVSVYTPSDDFYSSRKLILRNSLINKGISSLACYGGSFSRILDKMTASCDVFIGALVTQSGMDDVDLVQEGEPLLGIVMGPNSLMTQIPSEGFFYNDYDNPFRDNSWVRVGVLSPNQVVYALVKGNFQLNDKLKIDNGMLVLADIDDDFSFVAEESVSLNINELNYCKARFIK